MEERRRTPRHAAAGPVVGLPVSTSVRVLDMSGAGVLLQTALPPDLGTRARLNLSVAGEPLAVQVEVRRVAATPEGYRVGARFVDMTAEHRRLVERFMGS
jgi:c-di-GMP-binding flagellar brake protein YcgR